MRQPLLNRFKSQLYQLDTTAVFSIRNKSNSALKSPVIKSIKPSKTYLHSITLKQPIFQLELNCQNLDTETVELMNDSEYLERLEMLWEDSAEELLKS